MTVDCGVAGLGQDMSILLLGYFRECLWPVKAAAFQCPFPLKASGTLVCVLSFLEYPASSWREADTARRRVKTEPSHGRGWLTAANFSIR